VLFLVVKDHTGGVQVLVDEKRLSPQLREQVASWRIESVVCQTPHALARTHAPPT
jgi:aspartyl-tRNA synthetase